MDICDEMIRIATAIVYMETERDCVSEPEELIDAFNMAIQALDKQLTELSKQCLLEMGDKLL
jgi:hypothetical protein